MDFPRLEKKWLFRQLPVDVPEQQVKKIAADTGIHETVIRILALRGFSDLQTIYDFLNPTLHQLPRPHHMKGM